MAVNKYYYLRFRPKLNVNYLYLLDFYDLAEYNKTLNIKDTIYYQSTKLLGQKLNVSSSTITRIFNNADYAEFMQIDRKNKSIKLYNYFEKGTSDKFVKLTQKEVSLIRKIKDDLFTRYLIYIKYYCRYTKNNTNFTAKQFLSDCNYSTKAGNNISNLSNYNRILVDNGLIRIEKYRDELKHERNRYAYIEQDNI